MSDRIVCIGAAAVDRKYRALSRLQPNTSNPVDAGRSPGGVARNVAENLARLGAATALVSVVGDDDSGRWLLEGLRELGVDTSGVRVAAEATAEYVAVLEPGGHLAFGLANMRIFDVLGADILDEAAPALLSAAWVFADCNLLGAALERIVGKARQARFRLAADAVSTAKACRLPRDLEGVDLLFLNEAEAAAYLGSDLPAAAAALRLREHGAAAVALTRGAGGLLVAQETGVVEIPAHRAVPVDVTGAGDALVAATLFRLLAGDPLSQAARYGAVAAGLTIASRSSVRPDLSPRLIEEAMETAG